jgi:hypothetical protein
MVLVLGLCLAIQTYHVLSPLQLLLMQQRLSIELFRRLS